MQELEQPQEPIKKQPTKTLHNTQQSTSNKTDDSDRPDFEAAVGMSRKWDAREAGREVAETTIQKLHNPPDFFLLFSTIHYETHGGFQEFLNGVWDVLPKDTPLIGGTVAGFMTKEGVFSRGAVAVGISGNFNVEKTYARGTRKNPKHVAKVVSESLDRENSLLLTFLPGPSMPNVGKDKLIVTKSKTMVAIAPKALEISTVHLNKGVGREMEVLENLSKLVKSDIIGSSTIDDNRYNDNYQFFDRNYFSDSLVVLGIDNINFHLDTIKTMPIPEKWYDVTNKKTFGHILKKIDGKSALSVYLDERGYSSDLIFDAPDLVHRRFVFVPVLTKDEYGGIHPRCPGTFYGESLGFGHPIFNQVGFSLTDGKYINDQFQEFIKKFDQNKTQFLLMFSCAVLFEALGLGTFRIYENLKKEFKKDFLILFGGGEVISEKSTNEGPKILEMSLTGVGFY